MPDVQKVLEALPCLASVQHDCLKCSYNPHPGMPWPYGCIKGQGDIVQDAAELLERLVPMPVKRWTTHTQKRGYPYCPNPQCGRGLNEQEAYCEFCGQAIRWENEDKEDDSIA